MQYNNSSDVMVLNLAHYFTIIKTVYVEVEVTIEQRFFYEEPLLYLKHIQAIANGKVCT